MRFWSYMFKTHDTISFLFVHTQFTTVRTTIKRTVATNVGSFSSFLESSTGALLVKNLALHHWYFSWLKYINYATHNPF